MKKTQPQRLLEEITGEGRPADGLKRQVFEALGEASMQWHPRPAGEFDSTECKRIGDELWKVIQAWMIGDRPKPVSGNMNPDNPTTGDQECIPSAKISPTPPLVTKLTSATCPTCGAKSDNTITHEEMDEIERKHQPNLPTTTGEIKGKPLHEIISELQAELTGERKATEEMFLVKQRTVIANRELLRKLAESEQRTIDIVKRELDNCSHPECGFVRAEKGYADCAGGHLARQVVAALTKGL